MKGKNLLFAILGLILVCIFIWKRDSISKALSPKDSTNANQFIRDGYVDAKDAIVKTKSDRRDNSARTTQQNSTHTPERLTEFFLPPHLLIEDLTLHQALQILRKSYEDTCRETGEVPLKITFDLPESGSGQLISTRLKGTFADAIHYLAILARMQVERDGTVYRFTHPTEEAGAPIAKSYNVPAEFFSRLVSNYTGDPSVLKNLPPLELAKALGIKFSPDTQIAYLNGASRMIVRSGSAFDHESINNLIENQNSLAKTQHKIATKCVALSPDVDIELPEFSPISSDEFEQLMNQAQSLRGVDIMTLPSVIAKNGESAKVELGTREYYTSSDRNTEPLIAGVTLDLKSNRIGFGQNTSFHLQHTQFAKPSENSLPEEIVVEELLNAQQTIYVDGQDSAVTLETHPDGSRTLIFVTSTKVDSSGRPVESK